MMRDGLGVALLLSAIFTGESTADRPSEIATLLGVGVGFAALTLDPRRFHSC